MVEFPQGTASKPSQDGAGWDFKEVSTKPQGDQSNTSLRAIYRGMYIEKRNILPRDALSTDQGTKSSGLLRNLARGQG